MPRYDLGEPTIAHRERGPHQMPENVNTPPLAPEPRDKAAKIADFRIPPQVAEYGFSATVGGHTNHSKYDLKDARVE